MLVALVLSLVDLPLTRALMIDPAITSPEEPMKPRALTYTEMMNCGRQQMDEAEHVREQQLQQQVEDLEKDVDRLENHFRAVSTAPVRNWWLKTVSLPEEQ